MLSKVFNITCNICRNLFRQRYRNDRPQDRKYALVIWKHSYLRVPQVAQYRESDDIWFVDYNTRYQAKDCEWFPIPPHEWINKDELA